MAKINLDLVVRAAKALAALEKTRAQTEKVRAATKKINAQTKIYNQRLKQQSTRTKELNTRLKRTESQVRRTASAFDVFKGVLGAQVFTSIARSIGNLAASSVKVTGELETLSTQFEVLTGSAGTANKAVKDLQQFAASTPFQFKDLAKATQRLLSFGFTLEESQDNLKDLGDVAAASGSDINELALIFGQVNAAGKLTGERLLQLQERAIPIGPALAETLGVAESAVRDLVTQGKVDFKTFEAAFKSLNDQGKFAFEGTIKRSRTLEGRLSTLRDNFELLQANIGARLAPAFKALVSTVTIFIQRIQKTTAFNDFLETLSAKIPDAIDLVINSFSFLINSALNIQKAFNNVRSAIADAISSILDSLADFIDKIVKIEEFFGLDTFANADKQFSETLRGLSEGFDETSRVFDQNARDIEKSQKKINDVIKQGRDAIQAAYSKEIQLAEEQANATEDKTQRIVNAERGQTQEELKEIEKRRQARQKLIDDIKKAEEDLRVSQEATRLYQQEQEQIFTDNRLIALEDFFTREEEARIQAQINAADGELQKQQLILQAQIDGENRRLEQLAESKKKEMELEKQTAQDNIRNRQRTLSIISGLQQSGSKELVAIAKGAAITSIAIDTQEAVSGAYAWGNTLGGPAFGALLATVAATAQASRAAKVAGIQGFEQGGIVPGTSFTGDNVSARVNSGEMILNRQQQAELFRMANGGGSSQGGQQIFQANVTVELDNEVVGRATSNWVANGGQLGEVQ